MPLNLATRCGDDTVGKLVLAARRRYAEANRLLPNEPLGAVYLLGYTIEMRLKVAYYRVIGFAPNTLITDRDRRQAQAQIRTRFPGSSMPAGHNLIGWAWLLEHTRASLRGAIALPPLVATQMNAHVGNAALCWREVLRYRANKPYNEELAAVQRAARWFKRNASKLWS